MFFLFHQKIHSHEKRSGACVSNPCKVSVSQRGRINHRIYSGQSYVLNVSDVSNSSALRVTNMSFDITRECLEGVMQTCFDIMLPGMYKIRRMLENFSVKSSRYFIEPCPSPSLSSMTMY